MPDIATFLKSVKLPVMPEVAQALIQTLGSDRADVPLITAIIAKDPALTATLLRMANSAMFGLSRSVSTLDSAVSVVGTAQIRARALSICMSQVFAFPPGLNRLEFWGNCMVCAGYARWLATRLGMDEQQAWLTGMMLRLGELLIAQRLPESVLTIETQPCAPAERWRRERHQAGFDEGQLAGEIAQRWDFPASIADALRACCQPPLDNLARLAITVHLAALMADPSVPHPKKLDHLPLLLVECIGLNLGSLRGHVPDPASFSDISMLHG